jgi:hypothetical protein
MKDFGTQGFPYRLVCKEHRGWYCSPADAENEIQRQGYTGCSLERLVEGEYVPAELPERRRKR